MEDRVILVDETDRETGTMPKLEAHQKGLLHRAFSVFIFNSDGELLLQKRAADKYHSAGLWSNTCCSHPLPGEPVADAAQRRLFEEMGIECPLKPLFHFIYKTGLGNGLYEHELDHVFAGTCDKIPAINPAEVESYKYVPLAELSSELKSNPHRYTYWLSECFGQVMAAMNTGIGNFQNESK